MMTKDRGQAPPVCIHTTRYEGNNQNERHMYEKQNIRRVLDTFPPMFLHRSTS